jgi:thiamine-monophosphate kinase
VSAILEHPVTDGEFALISRYFDFARPRADVVLGIGDDGAIVAPPPGRQLVMSIDTLQAGVHFHADGNAEDIGWKCVAVNLSDLAAMGATPHWLLLSLSLPAIDHDWLQAFSRGLRAACEQYDAALIGGDTVRGPLGITIQATGSVDPACLLRRDAARAGDVICVTGTLGDAACALLHYPALERDNWLYRRLYRPLPRVEFGRRLAQFAHCAIDVSDGLLADLGHVLDASGVGAELDIELLPISSVLREACIGDLIIEAQLRALTGGDDYELCFTMPPAALAGVMQLAEELEVPVTCIGRVRAGTGVELVGAMPALRDRLAAQAAGYDHFRG